MTRRQCEISAHVSQTSFRGERRLVASGNVVFFLRLTQLRNILIQSMSISPTTYSYFKKGCRQKCARDNPERWYGIWSINCSWHCSCQNFFCCFPSAWCKHTSMASRVILSNFFEEQRTQNHPQYLSWLSRTLFPTIFLSRERINKRSARQHGNL